MTQNVDWVPVGEEGSKVFAALETNLQAMIAENSKWKIEIGQERSFGTSISLQYYETEEDAISGTGYQAVTASIQIRKTPTSAALTMRGNEGWEFEKSEKIVVRVSDELLKVVMKSGIAAMRSGEKTQLARNAAWSITWKLYPPNHPVVLSRGGSKER